MFPKGTGADPSPSDIRTFAWEPSGVPRKGGLKYGPEDINDQHRVGICTAISTTTNAQKALGRRFSADFQYLMQKRLVGNWDEGSSLSTAMKVAKNIGFLPEEYWHATTEEDRKLPYYQYIEKLKAVPEAEIDRLKAIAADFRIKAYAKVPTDTASLAQAIMESKAGVLTRYDLGNEWYRRPIQPLRPPKKVISGHAVTDSNYDGESFRIANSWGTDWADQGTAYRLQSQYRPTEAWIPYYDDLPAPIQKQVESRETKMARMVDLLQKVISLLKLQVPK